MNELWMNLNGWLKVIEWNVIGWLIVPYDLSQNSVKKFLEFCQGVLAIDQPIVVGVCAK